MSSGTRSTGRAPEVASGVSIGPSPQETGSGQGLLPALSLPKGGGAIRGIGEKFSTNPATGTGSLSVPIATSPGRAGFELSLTRLRLRRGQRSVRPRLATLDALDHAQDRQGAAALSRRTSDIGRVRAVRRRGPVPVRRPRRTRRVDRGDHRRAALPPAHRGALRAHRALDATRDGDVHWRAITRDNVLSVYGRQPVADRARIADPASAATRVFSWLLEETRDDRGNVARYRTRREDGAGVDPRSEASESHRLRGRSTGCDAADFRATAQRYLKRIQYGNRTPVDARRRRARLSDERLALRGRLRLRRVHPTNPTAARSARRRTSAAGIEARSGGPR